MFRGVLNSVAGIAGARDDEARNTRKQGVFRYRVHVPRGAGQHRPKLSKSARLILPPKSNRFQLASPNLERKCSGPWQGATGSKLSQSQTLSIRISWMRSPLQPLSSYKQKRDTEVTNDGIRPGSQMPSGQCGPVFTLGPSSTPSTGSQPAFNVYQTNHTYRYRCRPQRRDLLCRNY